MVSRLTGAGVRAFLVMTLIATPSAILPEVSGDTRQMVALLGLFAAAMTFVEYFSDYPSVLEFRDAPPFNRLRFLALFITVLWLSAVMVATADSAAPARAAAALAHRLGEALDFSYSPIRIVTALGGAGADAAATALLRAAAALALVTSLAALACFALIVHLARWPAPVPAFNMWVNLPTLELVRGSDAASQLRRHARINLALAFMLPLLMPALANLASLGSGALAPSSPQTLIWTVSAWAFIPLSLAMRALALARIATLIRDRHRRRGETPQDGGTDGGKDEGKGGRGKLAPV